jgi:superoxide dismutase, Fe-Mn family
MMPGGGGPPPVGSRIASLIDRDFGSYESFKQEFSTAANTAFGSGWAWLVHTPSGLKVSDF